MIQTDELSLRLQPEMPDHAAACSLLYYCAAYVVGMSRIKFKRAASCAATCQRNGITRHARRPEFMARTDWSSGRGARGRKKRGSMCTIRVKCSLARLWSCACLQNETLCDAEKHCRFEFNGYATLCKTSTYSVATSTSMQAITIDQVH